MIFYYSYIIIKIKKRFVEELFMKRLLLFIIMLITLTGCVNRCSLTKYWWFEDSEYKVYTARELIIEPYKERFYRLHCQSYLEPLTYLDYKINGVPEVKPQNRQ